MHFMYQITLYECTASVNMQPVPHIGSQIMSPSLTLASLNIKAHNVDLKEICRM